MSSRPAQATSSWRVALIPLMCMLPMMFACLIPIGQRTETQYVVTQQARLPAPEGPKAVGEMTPQGKISLQGSAHYQHVVEGESNEARAGIGHLIHNRSFQGRLGIGLGRRLELGLGGSYSHNTWTKATSDLLPDEAPEGPKEHKFLASAQTRFLIVGDRKAGVAGLVEGDFGTVHFQRTVQTTTTTTLINVDGSETQLPPVVERETTSSDDFFWVAKAGIQGHYSVLPWLSLQGGFIGQNYPRYWARRISGTTCEDDNLYDGVPASCNGDAADDLEVRNMLVLGTAFAGASLSHPSIPISAHGQLHYNALSPSIVRGSLPFGAALALRLTF